MATQDISNMSVTWDDVDTIFSGIQLNVTNTASDPGSYLARLQVDSADVFTAWANGSVSFISAGGALQGSAFADGYQLVVQGGLTEAPAVQVYKEWDMGTSSNGSAFDIYVTDTSSAAGSKPLSVSVNGTPVFTVLKDGYTFVGGPLEVAAGTDTIGTPVLDATQAWNDAGTAFVGITLDITDTASSADSRLLDLKVGGDSRFNIDKQGTIRWDPNSAWKNYISVDSNSEYLTISGHFGLYILTGSSTDISDNALRIVDYGGSMISVGKDFRLAFANDNWYDAQIASFGRASDKAAITLTAGMSTTVGFPLQFCEQPSAPAGVADAVRIYAEDNGSGKTRLMAIFGSGAAQQIAIEP